MSPQCPHNMVNVGPLAAEIVSLVWGTPGNFNGLVSRLGSVTARHSSSGRQPNLAALNRGHHLYASGRPSRWALAHVLVRSSFLAYSQLSQIECLPYFHTWCGLSVNLRCRRESWCMWLAENTGRKKRRKFAICAPSHMFVGLYLRN